MQRIVSTSNFFCDRETSEVKFIGVSWVRLFSGVLMFCATPLASAMIGSYYGPGYSLSPGQVAPVSPYSPSRHPSWQYPETVHGRPAKFIERYVGFRYGPYGHPRYRFRPMDNAFGHKPRYGSYGAASAMAAYRWRPTAGRAVAGQYPVEPFGWQRALAYGVNPTVAQQYRGYPYAGERIQRSTSHHYRFRPITRPEHGASFRHRVVSMSATPVGGYRFRPLVSQRDSEPMGQRDVSSSLDRLSRPIPNYVFRPVTRNPMSHQRPSFSTNLLRDGPYTYAGMPNASSRLSDVEISAVGEAGARSSVASQSRMMRSAGATSVKGEDVEYVIAYSHNRPLMSQYAVDERIMNGYENNNF